MIAIMPSKRTGMYYLEYCRISQVDEKIVYNQAKKGITQYLSLPIANTNIILMGTGTSITQAAMRIMAENGVMLAVVGGGGTPLYLASQSEYRPNEYFFAYLKKWQDPIQCLEMAKQLQLQRINFVEKQWQRLNIELEAVIAAGETFQQKIKLAKDNEQLRGYEANYAKKLYAVQIKHLNIEKFTRKPGKKDETDVFNSYLDHARYLAYGLAAVTLWVLGIPHSMAVSHGATRRGALVFDLADVIKDGIVMPVAMSYAKNDEPRNKMRKRCIAEFNNSKTLDVLFNCMKQLIEK
ncbi:type I-F CRISPR-associated endonuclease Cas1f [Candidatus Halobeggiatoa sp. HSG11]|nr:type I-F CRISPR-associated endonuclease Cas1f [Candidatus Halobeggiatoa sp. HSG11]